jgi:hypothetical protein
MTYGVDLKGVWHQLACTYRKPKAAVDRMRIGR